VKAGFKNPNCSKEFLEQAKQKVEKLIEPIRQVQGKK